MGDLAEEFASRADRDGVRPARHWYYRELLRTTPHVLRSWLSGLKPRDAARLAAIAYSSLTFLIVLDLLATMLILSVARAFGFAHGFPVGAPHSFTRLLIQVMVGVPNAALGGVIAASLGDRTPLLSGLALGVAWAGTALLVQCVVVLAGHGAHSFAATIGINAVSGTALIGLALLGAMLRIRAGRDNRASAATGS